MSHDEGGDPIDEIRYAAVQSRDARFDGEFFTAVASTGIYCRPSCPATTPLRRNVSFFRTAAAAQHNGFRACKRCRPDAVPGSAAWDSRGDTVARAIRLIEDGIVDRDGVTGLATRLGYSTRQLGRQLTAELGVGPLALARAQRAHTARILLQTTPLPVTDVAHAAGFGSIRQFNDTIREVFATSPSALRGARHPDTASRHHTAGGVSAEGFQGAAQSEWTPIELRLPFRPPMDTAQVFDYLAAHSISGMEAVSGTPRKRSYRRGLTLPAGYGLVTIDERLAEGQSWLRCQLLLTDLRDLAAAIARVRRIVDADSDAPGIDSALSASPAGTGSGLRINPGVRSPGSPDGGEAALRTVLGQQVTRAAAARLGGALVAALGAPLPFADSDVTLAFPSASAIAGSSLEMLAMPGSRRDCLRGLAESIANGSVDLSPGCDRREAAQVLLSHKGIGPWTVAYTQMHGLADPDVSVPADAVIRAQLRRYSLDETAIDASRPWRSYLMHQLWRNAAKGTPDE